MKLEDIGFYTLSDYRAKQTGWGSPMWRCELIITDKCNFKCPYCRGTNGIKDIEIEEGIEIIKSLSSMGLKNIRFSGGEPTLYMGLGKLVVTAKSQNIERIAISTNGSADWETYYYLLSHGINDFSVSLDACCSSTNDLMTGKKGYFTKVTENIKKLSQYSYVTVGIVLTNKNIPETKQIIKYTDRLGVSDIRIIPAAQLSKHLNKVSVPQDILSRHPILKYRINNARIGKQIRGLVPNDSRRCYLVLDDLLVAGEYHYPCVIYFREGGKPIGKIDDNIIRQERYDWFSTHNSYIDSICRNNCLDVCIDFNNKCREYER